MAFVPQLEFEETVRNTHVILLHRSILSGLSLGFSHLELLPLELSLDGEAGSFPGLRVQADQVRPIFGFLKGQNGGKKRHDRGLCMADLASQCSRRRAACRLEVLLQVDPSTPRVRLGDHCLFIPHPHPLASALILAQQPHI